MDLEVHSSISQVGMREKRLLMEFYFLSPLCQLHSDEDEDGMVMMVMTRGVPNTSGMKAIKTERAGVRGL